MNTAGGLERLSMLQWLAIASIIVASAGAAMTSRAPVTTAASGEA